MTTAVHPTIIPRATRRRSKTGLARGANAMKLDVAREKFIGALERGEIASERMCSPATCKRYNEELRRFIDWVKVHATKGRADCEHFTAELVRQYLAYRHDERKVGRSTLSLDSVILRAFAAWGAGPDIRYWRWDDVAGIRYVKKVQTLPRPYNPVERDEIMSLTLAPAEHALRALLYYAGLRNAEVCGVRLEDLRGPHGLPTGETIPASVRVIGKGMRERFVPLHPDGWRALESYLAVRVTEKTELTEYLFRTLPGRRRGKDARPRPWTDQMVQRRVKNWGKAAGAAKATPHRFRHTFATDVLEATDNLRTTQELLGHVSPQTTAIYTKITDRRKAEAVLKLPSFGPKTPPQDCPAVGNEAAGPQTNA